VKSSRGKTNRSSRRAAREAELEHPTEVAGKPSVSSAPVPDTPEQKIAPPAPQPSLGESATQFAKGFAHGVSAESLQIYNDTKELPTQLAKTGREILEDIHANRRVRALAPLAAMEHALRNASRKDVERIAHAVVDGAKEWLDKPAYEKGESLGRATTAIASEVAIDVLTDGLGSVALLRKVEKVAEAADHVRDAEKVVEKAAQTAEKVEAASAAARAKGGVYVLRDRETGQVVRTGRTNDHERRRDEHNRPPETKPLKYQVVNRVDDPDVKRGLEQMVLYRFTVNLTRRVEGKGGAWLRTGGLQRAG